MKRKNDLLANPFDSSLIIPSRLVSFAKFVAVALAALPDSATYADIIAAINAAIADMDKEGDDVSVNLIDQKEDTSSSKEFRINFTAFMKDNRMAIGGALGGENSAGYKAFYPHNITEYSRITVKRMDDVTLRLQTVTKKYGLKLPADMATTLSGFNQGWKDVFNKQQGQISTVQIDRTQRSAAFTRLQLVMTKAVHKVGFENPGNEALGKKLFPTHLLYAPARKNALELTGVLATGESRNLLNRRMTGRVSVLVDNMSNNSDLCLWLGATADATAPVNACVVKAGDTKKISISKLGYLSGTFLMIANLSAANAGDYVVTVTGLPKEKKLKMEVVKKGVKKKKTEEQPAENSDKQLAAAN